MERQIMDAAAELFAKNGFEATSMDEVADKAGVAKGSLYYHFKGKSQLFARTAVDGIQFITRELQKSVNAAYSPQSAASQIICSRKSWRRYHSRESHALPLTSSPP